MKILGIPILYKENVALNLLEGLESDINNIYNSKQWPGTRGKRLKKSSLYDESGNHKAYTKEDPMEGVNDFPELYKIIHENAIEYMEQFRMPPIILESLKKRWHSLSWHTTMDEEDDYGWHAHNSYHLIVTYYVKRDEEHSPLLFKSPDADLFASWIPGDNIKGEHNALEQIFYPKPGDLMVWPAWLEHQVPGLNFEAQQVIGEEKDKYKNNRISITTCFVKPGMQFTYQQEYNNEQR